MKKLNKLLAIILAIVLIMQGLSFNSIAESIVNDGQITGEITGIIFDKEEYKLAAGESCRSVVQVVYSVTDSVYSENPIINIDDGVAFESSDLEVAIIGEDGIIIALNPGTAYITAHYNRFSAKSIVIVQGNMSSPILNFTEINGEVILNWTNIENADCYIIKRGLSPGKLKNITDEITDTTYTDDSIKLDKTYFYAVSAVVNGIEGANSNVIMRTATPEEPELYGLRKSDMIKVSWTSPFDTEKFILYRSNTPGGPYDIILNQVEENRYIDTDITSDAAYYYTVIAIDAQGRESQLSREIAVEPLSGAEKKFKPDDDNDGDSITNEEELFRGTDLEVKNEVKVSISERVINKEENKKSNKVIPRKINRTAKSKDGKIKVTVYGDDNLADAPLIIGESEDIFLKSLKGAVSEPVEISAGGIDINSAEISIPYDRKLLKGIEEENLKIYWVDRKNRILVPLENTVVDTENMVVIATTTHFSTYILGGNMPVDLKQVDMVFAIDQSLGLNSIDTDNYRLKIAKKFVTTMSELNVGPPEAEETPEEDKIKIGLTEFSDYGSLTQALTTNQSDLVDALETMEHFIGATNIADGIWISKSQFDLDDMTRRKILVLVTDGLDTCGNTDDQIKRIVDAMAAKNVVINVVALGSNVNSQLLKYIAEKTKGGYFPYNISSGMSSEEADELTSVIYDKIRKQVTLDIASVPPAPFTQALEKVQYSEKYKGYDYAEARRLYTNAHANLITGNYLTQATDINIGSTGPDLTILRTYNSDDGYNPKIGDSVENSSLGRGWRLNYDSYVDTITTYGRIKASALNVRVSPGLDQTIISKLPWGTVVKYVSEPPVHVGDYDWQKIILPDQREGYVADYYLVEISFGAQVTYGSGTRIVFEDKDGYGLYKTPYGVEDILRETTTSYELTKKDMTKYVYEKNINGKLKSIIDRYGNQVQITYEGNRIKEIIEPVNRKLTFEYNAMNLVSRITDSMNRYVQYIYDGNKNLIGVIDLDGKKTTYTYHEEKDDAGVLLHTRINQIIDANGHQVIKNEYDVFGRLVKQYDGNDNIKYHIYKDAYEDEDGKPIVGFAELIRYYIDENGNESMIEYNPVTQKPIKEMDTYGNTITRKYYLDYDNNGTWTEITNISENAPGYSTYLQEINDGCMPSKEEIIDKNNYKTTSIYDSNNNLRKVIDAKNKVSEMIYDSSNNLTETIDRKSNHTYYTYSADNTKLEKVTDALGNETVYTYHVPGPGIVINGLVDTVTENLKDKNGNLVSGFKTTTYKYLDGYNNRTEIIDSLNQSTKEVYDAAGRLLEITNARNFTTKFTYDKMNRLLEEEDALLNKTTIQYDNVGNKRFVINKNRYTTEYVYDNENQLIKVIDAKGYTIEYKYDGVGNKIEEKNQKGGITEYDYDARNRLICVTDPQGAKTFSYYDVSSDADEDGNAAGYNNVKTVNAEGLVIITEFDELNRKQIVREIFETPAPGERSTTYTYDDNSNLLEVKDACNKSTKYDYDALNRVISIVDGFGLGSSYENTTLTEYDIFVDPQGLKFERITNTDALQYSTINEYDPLGQLVKSINAKQEPTTYTYDTVGNCLTVTDPKQHMTTYEYDVLNRNTKIIDATGINFTTLEYDAVGNNTAKVDRRNNRTEFQYNRLNQLIKTIDPLLKITGYSYDEMGNQSTITDANNNTTGYAYDLAGRLICEVDTENYAKYYRYDTIGNMIWESTRKNQYVGTTWHYDKLNRLTMVEDAEHTPTTYTYDLLDNVLTQNVGGLSLATYEYDPMYRVKKKITGTHQETYDIYDVLGNLKQKTDRNNTITTYIYDELNRLTNETAGIDSRQFSYDASGNLETTTDETGTTTYVYDALNLLDWKTVDYSYDAEGNNTSVKDPDNNVIDYSYDELNRLETVSTTEGTSTYTYYDNGNRESLTLPNGTVTTYHYNPRNLLTSLVNQTGGVNTTYTYEYDADGLQLYKAEPKGRTDFEYDDLGRIKKVTEPGNRITQYTYDNAGNRDTQTVDATGLDVDIDYTYNSLNRLIQTVEVRNGITTANDFVYDNNGNQKTVTETVYGGSTNLSNYVYDNFNQLKTAQTPDGKVITSKYDAFGMRIEKTVDGVATTYHYDGTNVILEETGATHSRNVYGLNLISRNDETGSLYYLYNGHADVVKLINASGSLINEYDYDIFGNPILETGPANNPYRYAGYYYDGETGYYYLNARYYDPKNARFITEDTYFGEYTDPLSLNLYTYCLNNPLVYYDPTGHWPEWGDRAGDFFRNVLKDIGLAVGKSLASSVSGTFKVVAYAGAKANGDTKMANAVWTGMSNAEDQANSFIENNLVTNKAVYDETTTITDIAQIMTGIAGIAKGGAKVATKVVSKVIAKSVAKEADNILAATVKGTRGLEPVISASGKAEDIMFSGANLSTKQAKLLEQLPDFGSRAILPKKMYSTSDLAALTAQTGDEFAMFTTGGRRMIIRGNPRSVPINTSAAEQLANQGWRWSAHSHPGISQTVLTASGGDRAVLSQFINQAKSRIFNSVGRSQPFGKDFSDWLPGQ